MNNPKVSIIVPVYNVEKYIHICVDSILSQTFTEFECILVDDCTPDNSGRICDEYAMKDNRIKVIHKPQNEGLPQARKTGFENSTGTYIQFVDSDDWIEPELVDRLYSFAMSNEYDMICCDWYRHNKKNEIIYKKMPIISSDYINNIKNIILVVGLEASVWNKFYKREVLEHICFPLKNFYEDKFISTQTFYYSKNIGYYNAAFYHYMHNEDSLLNNKNIIKNYKKCHEEFVNFRKMIIFVKQVYGKNLSVLEPELSKRKELIRARRLEFIKNILKTYLKRIFKK